MKSVDIYLNFPGNTEEVFNFYKSVFGGDFKMLQRFKEVKDMPGLDKMSEAGKEQLMHVSLPIGSSVLMGSDTPETMKDFKLKMGNNFSVSVNVDSKEEAEKLFKALSEGGEVHMPLKEEFWGAYFGMVMDKFGIRWMISYQKPMKTAE